MAITKIINSGTKTHGALRNCIEYVLRDSKTSEELVYMSGPSPEEITWDSVYKSFLDEKKLWEKDSGRMYYHSVISFPKEELITSEQALEFGKEFSDSAFRGFQTLVVVHEDREHLHVHFVTNSVSYEDGNKIHLTKYDLQNMKELTNQMCEERNLSVAIKNHHSDGSIRQEGDIVSWNKNEYRHLINDSKDSYMANCGYAVMNAIEQSTNQEQFISAMKSQGWEVEWNNKKHITYKDDEGHKIRDSRIEKTFHIDATKENLQYEFERKATELAEKESRRATEQQHTHHIRR